MAPQQAASSSSSETSDLREEEGWEDAEPDNEELSFVSFFDEKTFPDAISMLEYSKEKYQFDFISIQKEHGPFIVPYHAHNDQHLIRIVRPRFLLQYQARQLHPTTGQRWKHKARDQICCRIRGR